MIRKLLELMISRSIDDGKPLPGWVDRATRRDPQLGRFYNEAKQLDDQLRDSASLRRSTLPVSVHDNNTPIVCPSPTTVSELRSSAGRRSQIRWSKGLAAVAAVLLVAFLAIRSDDRSTGPAEAEMLAQHLTEVPHEMLFRLTRAAEISQAHLSRHSPISNLAVPRLPSLQEVASRFESPMSQEFGTLLSDLQGLARQIRALQGESDESRVTSDTNGA